MCRDVTCVFSVVLSAQRVHVCWQILPLGVDVRPCWGKARGARVVRSTANLIPEQPQMIWNSPYVLRWSNWVRVVQRPAG